MSFSRITAFIAVCLTIAVLTIASIFLTKEIGTAITHGPGAEVEGGYVQRFDTPHSFYLKTDSGAVEHFECIERCMDAQSHMHRHISEDAHTNVYYMRTPTGDLDAVDVD
ncbi:hypothetical protein ccbrp13_44480 [Ktedonobacteria bacterium brp13]|nr:hypothetical protein ccbrp13_44480 [Ktedonobacteria bacterium brp13]